MQPSPLVALALALTAGAPAVQLASPPPPIPQTLATAGTAGQGPNASGAGSTSDVQRPVKPLKDGGLQILVLNNAAHGFAAAAASKLSLATIANTTNFNALLTSQAWDVVAVDDGNSLDYPWTPLIDYVNAGGRAVVSVWHWDKEPALASAFDVQVLDGFLSFTGSVLLDSGITPAFLGVTMPNSSWHDHYGVDGDRFLPLAGAQGLAHVGNPSQPVMVRGNDGRTIAAPLFAEAGDTWIADGSAVRLWENLIRMVADTDGPDVLVYDQDSNRHLAQHAAFETAPGTTRLANSSTFDALLQSQSWDAVLVDCPDTRPVAGWGALIQHVNAGGRAALSFWDWDNDVGFGDPALPAAFDVAVAGDLSWTGLTLFDSGLTDVFQGVTVPISSWNDGWNDDGDRFTPVAPARGLGHVGNPSEPVLVWGNGGRTMAASVLDEAGPQWLFDGSGVQLWSNLLAMILGTEPDCGFRNGILGLNPSDYTCVVPPVVGGTWVVDVDMMPLLGTTSLATVVALGLGGPAQGIPLFGFELLILPPFATVAGFGTHAIAVPPDPLLAGFTLASQAARVELGSGGALRFVLTNAQDVTFGI